MAAIPPHGSSVRSITPPRDASADIGLVGLGVMGQNLVLNMADHGYAVAVHNRTPEATAAFVADHPAASFSGTGGGLVPSADVRDFVRSIRRPRRVVLLIKAGPATDSVIEMLAPLLEAGDLIVDGGNADWNDTVRREKALAARGLLFVGSGVSGGEEGARFGPSLMPGGTREAWGLLEPVWRDIAAKVDPATGKPLIGAAPGKPIRAEGAGGGVGGGVPCTAYIGPGGSGHFVKMVHNGIEYGDMQLICEAYDFLRGALEMPVGEMAGVFEEWNRGDLDSFLIEITADILRQKDPATGKPFVDVVLDAAGQKGTGKWTVSAAMDLGVPVPTIAEAVTARMVSALKEERAVAAGVLGGPDMPATHVHGAAHIGSGDGDWVGAVRDALYCSKICSYAQGFALMRGASEAQGWGLDPGTIAQIWRGGCIIRARFLQKITGAYTRDPALPNLLLDPYFAGAIGRAQNNWRKVVARAAVSGVPVPAFGSALSYYDSYRSANLPANLLQAQRDYFGAHTYERVDRPRGEFYHLDWSGAEGKGRVERRAGGEP